MLLGELLECLEHLAVDESEVAGIDGEGIVRQRVEHAIVELGRELFHKGFAFALVAHGIDYVAALPQVGLDHLGYYLGRVLQVDVDNDGHIARTVVQTGTYGILVAEVARERQHLGVRVVLGKAHQQLFGAVLAAVVDENKLIVVGGTAHDLGEAPVRQREYLLFVVAGNDDRYFHGLSLLFFKRNTLVQGKVAQRVYHHAHQLGPGVGQMQHLYQNKQRYELYAITDPEADEKQYGFAHKVTI